MFSKQIRLACATALALGCLLMVAWWINRQPAERFISIDQPRSATTAPVESAQDGEGIAPAGTQDPVVAESPLVGTSLRTALSVEGDLSEPAGQLLNLVSAGFNLVPYGGGHRVEIKNGSPAMQVGAPNLPLVVHGFASTPGRSVVNAVEDLAFDTYPDVDIAPLVTDDGSNPPAFQRGDIYAQDAFWPREIVQVEEAYIGRRKLARVSVSPFQYNPVTRELRHYREVRASLCLAEEHSPMKKDVAAGFFKRTSSGFDADASGGAMAGDCDCAEPIVTIEDLIPPTTGQATDFALRQAGVAFDACYKVRVRNTGLHRLTYANLLAAGLPDGELVGSNLRMFYGEREIAIQTSTNGKFTHNTNHHLTFYGEALRDDATNDNIYWIGFGAGGLRMMNRAAPDNAGLGTPIDQACQQVSLNQGDLWFDTTIDTLRDAQVDVDDGAYNGWFIATITEVPGSTTINYPNQAVASIFFPGTDHATTAGQTQFKGTAYSFAAQGATRPHAITARNVGGQLLFDALYQGVSKYELDEIFSNGFLDAAGTTRVNLVGYDGLLDRQLLRDASMAFPRHLFMIDDRLSFGGAAGNRRFALDGLSSGVSAEIWLLDVSDGYEPVRLTGFSTFGTADGSGLRFTDNQSYNPCYFVSGANGVRNVPAVDVEIARFSNLSDLSRQYDYIAIVPDGYESEARRLLEHRDQLGVDVLVTTEDAVYNEFGYGIAHPVAIQQFLGYAFHHWVAEPKYVLLVGDGHYDPLNRAGGGLNEEIPARMKVVGFAHAPVDQFYVQVNGADKVPDMAIGRAPVNNLTEFRNMVDKIIAHDAALDGGSLPGTWRSRLHFSADNVNGGFDQFAADLQSDIINRHVQAPYTTDTSFLPEGANAGQIAATRSTLINAINNGRAFVGYFGHGSTVQWASELNFFNTSDVTSALSNTAVFPIVTVFTCQNGIYHLPHLVPSCMAETLVRTPNKGAVAVIAPTAPALHVVSLPLGESFYHAALNGMVPNGFLNSAITYEAGEIRTLGDAFLSGMAGMFVATGGGAFEMEFYHIFGDPGTLVRQ